MKINPLHTHTHTHTFTHKKGHGGVAGNGTWVGATGVLPQSGSSLRYPIIPSTPDPWPADFYHTIWMPSHPGGGKGRANLLWEVLVLILQISLAKRPSDMLISTESAPGI